MLSLKSSYLTPGKASKLIQEATVKLNLANVITWSHLERWRRMVHTRSEPTAMKRASENSVWWDAWILISWSISSNHPISISKTCLLADAWPQTITSQIQSVLTYRWIFPYFFYFTVDCSTEREHPSDEGPYNREGSSRKDKLRHPATENNLSWEVSYLPWVLRWEDFPLMSETPSHNPHIAV